MKSFKEQCVALRKKDKTLNEIVKITGRSKTSVWFHIRNISLSPQKRQEISRRTRQQALRVAASRKGKALRSYKPFKNWTPELVLLISHLMFDGEILKRKCVYHNRSHALTGRVERLMCEVYDFSPIISIDKVSGVRRVRYYNVALSHYLHNKAVELQRDIVGFSWDKQREFIRAFFDDEGCMDYRPRSNVRRVRGYQNDQTILRTIQSLLAKRDITSKLENGNEIVIIGKGNLKNFQSEINFSEGVYINPNRSNSRWKQEIEKRELLNMAIASFKI